MRSYFYQTIKRTASSSIYKYIFDAIVFAINFESFLTLGHSVGTHAKQDSSYITEKSDLVTQPHHPFRHSVRILFRYWGIVAKPNKIPSE